MVSILPKETEQLGIFSVVKTTNYSDRDKTWPIFHGKSHSKSVNTYPSHYIPWNVGPRTVAVHDTFWTDSQGWAEYAVTKTDYGG